VTLLRIARSTRTAAAVFGLLLGIATATAFAQSASEDKDEERKPADPDTGKSTLSDETLGLLPNPFEKDGVKLALTYIGETLGNVSGGARRAAIYEGRVNAAIDVDFAKRAGWSGATFHANVFQIHGRGLSRDYLGNLMQVSGVEARPSTRLYEIWLEQKFLNEKLSVRAGQLAAEGEFINSKYSDVFVNSTYNWPTIFQENLPSGGPSPPLAAVGARVRAEPRDNFTVLAAIFNGDPAGPGDDDPQVRNRHGTNFRTSDSRLLIGELQYAYNRKSLPGTIKVGGWHHNGLFDDPRFASNGESQAAPGAPAEPAQLRSNHALYSVVEQMVVRFPGDNDARGIGAFGRVSTSPGKRNLIDLYADGGVSVIGPLASRPKDKIGFGFAYARISGRARDLDRDFRSFGVSPRPVRSYEALITASYLVQVRTGWTVLPTFQYIIHPGGGYVVDDESPRAVKNAAVLGLRMTLKF
jgi:porin